MFSGEEVNEGPVLALRCTLLYLWRLNDLLPLAALLASPYQTVIVTFIIWGANLSNPQIENNGGRAGGGENPS